MAKQKQKKQRKQVRQPVENKGPKKKEVKS